MEPVGARCAQHPDAPAVAPCARCGTFLCGACTDVRGEAAYCAPCLAFLRHHGPPSRGVQGVLGLGLAGLVCFPLFGGMVPLFNLLAAVLGLWVPTRELRRIARGEGPLRGVRQAKVARVLGGVNLVLALLWLGIFAYAWRHGAVQ